jgi:hypothetical protein
MVEINESILGPEAAPQFFAGNQFARPLCQRRQKLKRLLLASNADSVLPQETGSQIQLIGTETDGGLNLIRRTHDDLVLHLTRRPTKKF